MATTTGEIESAPFETVPYPTGVQTEPGQGSQATGVDSSAQASFAASAGQDGAAPAQAILTGESAGSGDGIPEGHARQVSGSSNSLQWHIDELSIDAPGLLATDWVRRGPTLTLTLNPTPTPTPSPTPSLNT